jgi:hypothetical protein
MKSNFRTLFNQKSAISCFSEINLKMEIKVQLAKWRFTLPKEV